jgi:hypothetical protein
MKSGSPRRADDFRFLIFDFRLPTAESDMVEDRITTVEELIQLAWKVGVVYFQVYRDKPDARFYGKLSNLQPYERIVEIQADSAPRLLSWLSFKGHLPFFSAVTGGWICDITDNSEETDSIIAEARKQAVLPDEDQLLEGDQEITLEGPPINED